MPTSIPHGRGVVVWGSGVLQQTGRPPIPRPTVPRSDSLEPYGAGRIFLLTVWEQLVGAHFCRVTGSGVAPFKKRNWGQSWNFSLIEKKHDKNFKRVQYEQKRRKIKTYYQNFDTPQATPVKLFRSIGGNLYFLWGRLWRFSIFDISVSPFITYFFEENPFFFLRDCYSIGPLLIFSVRQWGKSHQHSLKHSSQIQCPGIVLHILRNLKYTVRYSPENY